jgi:hypothetical protein
MTNGQASEQVSINLSLDQALVLSAWLERRMHQKEFAGVVDDRAVWSALLRIAGSLDVQLTGIFDESYKNLLSAARERLVSELGDFGLATDSNEGTPREQSS